MENLSTMKISGISLFNFVEYIYVCMYESERGNGSECKFTSQLTVISNLAVYVYIYVRGRETNLCANNGPRFY